MSLISSIIESIRFRHSTIFWPSYLNVSMDFLHQVLQASKLLFILSFQLEMFDPQVEGGLYLNEEHLT